MATRLTTVLLMVGWGLAAAVPAQAQTLIDAGTIELDGKRMRLWGIDVPDADQSCDDGRWLPRQEATQALRAYVGDRKLECVQVSFDAESKMPEALCSVGNDDLQSFLVSRGWAWVRRPGPLKYINFERIAEQTKAGVHGHDCLRADRWRRRQPAGAPPG